MFVNSVFKEIKQRRRSFKKKSAAVSQNIKKSKERQEILHNNFLKMKKDNDTIFSRYRSKEQ